jgi:hypothetical protein
MDSVNTLHIVIVKLVSAFGLLSIAYKDCILSSVAFLIRYMRSRDPSALNTQVSLCGECLIGQSIPVLRPSIGKWNIGEVVFFDRSAGAHRLVFDENDIEWVFVPPTPFKDYISHHLATAEQATLLDMSHFDDLSLCSRDSVIERGSGDYLIFRNGEFSFEYTNDGDESIEDTSGLPALQNIFVPKFPQPTDHHDDDHCDSLLRSLEANMNQDEGAAEAPEIPRQTVTATTCRGQVFPSIFTSASTENNDGDDNNSKTKAGPRLWTSDVSLYRISVFE